MSRADLKGPVDVRLEGAIATITLNRPGARNAMNRDMIEHLSAAIEKVGHDPAVRVVILTGAGELAFCAGIDYAERDELGDDEVQAFFRDLRATFSRLARLPRPVIAAINGFAIGLGTELAVCADVRLAAQSATLGLTDVRMAVVPGAGGTQRLSRLIGVARAKELILTGRRISARDAEQIGLVNAVIDDEELAHTARQWAEEFLITAPLAVAEAKNLIDSGFDMPLDEALALEAAAFERLLRSRDRGEAMSAFQEKRATDFQGS